MRLLIPWDSPGKNTGVGCHFLLRGIFLTQGSNPGLPHCRWILYQRSLYWATREALICTVGSKNTLESITTPGCCNNLTVSDWIIFTRLCVLSHFSPLWLFATLWTVVHQPPPSMGFSRQEYWIGLPFPSPGDLPDPGVEGLLSCIGRGFFTAEPPGSPSLLQCLSSNHTYCPQGQRDILPCYQWFRVYKTWCMVCLRFPLFL